MASPSRERPYRLSGRSSRGDRLPPRSVRVRYEIREDLVQRVLFAERYSGLLVLDHEVDVLPGGAEPLVHFAARHVERDRAGRVGRRALFDLVRRVGEEDLQRASMFQEHMGLLWVPFQCFSSRTFARRRPWCPRWLGAPSGCG
jgi:hypothetical protein